MKPNPPLSPEEQAELAAFNAHVEASRNAVRGGKTPLRELRWMFIASLIFLVVETVLGTLATAVFPWPVSPLGGNINIAATYVSIIGLVVSGWGIFRSLRGVVRAREQARNLALKLALTVYLVAFFMLFAGHFVTFGMFEGWMHSRDMFGSSPMRRK